MGNPHPPTPALLLVAASSRYEAALAWGLRRAEAEFGPLAAASDAFNFTETDYYAAEMGGDLKKQFWAFAAPIDPGQLAAIKLATNSWETEYSGLQLHSEPRPLNLDPGYLTLAKLVLASTKDHAHRIYLGHARVSRRGLAAARVDVSRLSPGGFPRLLHTLPRVAQRRWPAKLTTRSAST
jgi:hypothetical protein